MSDFEKWIVQQSKTRPLLRLNKMEWDILRNHTQPAIDGPQYGTSGYGYMLKDSDKAMQKHKLTYRELRQILDKLEDLAATYQLQEFLYGD